MIKIVGTIRNWVEKYKTKAIQADVGIQVAGYSSFFVFMKRLKKELLKKIKINFTVIFTSMVYMLFKSKFVSSPTRFCAVQW